ncbi:hypothetical protein COR50_10355 [Chitinophaga caeni]|uniref:DUF1579 domain-containing protein n=1 Tax=Chitinophaga caeni TaxID=2029983 RepID=A0A291QUC8_9BACT|nr:DUF1579 domain-containing protein [Chitinophaga caeni]ATL47537.1 hypothetical protein COR50_10355 [Chitinophaga caeni]
MKKSLLLFIGCIFAAFSLHAQDDPDAMQKAWMEYMTPGEFHKKLANLDGEWSAKITAWQAPGADPTVSEGSCTNKMILGGRYQECKYTGQFMDMPFEGKSWIGYDNGRKMFVSSWIDNMGTGMMYMDGKWLPDQNGVEFKGSMTDPGNGQEYQLKEIMKITDDDHYSFEMYRVVNGQEFKEMEIQLSRMPG